MFDYLFFFRFVNYFTIYLYTLPYMFFFFIFDVCMLVKYLLNLKREIRSFEI
jgi:hypothetical protein